jgi:hypothetical protein
MLRKIVHMGLAVLAAALVIVATVDAQTTIKPAATTPMSGVLEWTESVSTGGIGAASECLLVGRARHIRFSTASSDIRVYGIVKVRNSSGQLTSRTIRKPFGESGKYPPAFATYWSLDPNTTNLWNEFANVGVDSLVIYSQGTTADVKVQIILE